MLDLSCPLYHCLHFWRSEREVSGHRGGREGEGEEQERRAAERKWTERGEIIVNTDYWNMIQLQRLHEFCLMDWYMPMVSLYQRMKTVSKRETREVRREEEKKREEKGREEKRIDMKIYWWRRQVSRVSTGTTSMVQKVLPPPLFF